MGASSLADEGSTVMSSAGWGVGLSITGSDSTTISVVCSSAVSINDGGNVVTVSVWFSLSSVAGVSQTGTDCEISWLDG